MSGVGTREHEKEVSRLKGPSLKMIFTVLGLTIGAGVAEAGGAYWVSAVDVTDFGARYIQQFAYTPFSGLYENGFVARLSAEREIGDYTYGTNPGPGPLNEHQYGYHNTFSELEAGYQIVGKYSRIMASVGFAHRKGRVKFINSPWPYEGVAKDIDHTGVKLGLEGYANPPELGGWGLNYLLHHVTVLDEYWYSVRPDYRWPSGFTVGLDDVFEGVEGVEFARVGLFVENVPVGLPIFTEVSGGAMIHLTDENEKGKTTPYVLLTVGVPF